MDTQYLASLLLLGQSILAAAVIVIFCITNDERKPK
jgi:hypothetical protein